VTAFIGYMGDNDDNMTPVAADVTREACFSRTPNRIVEICEGDWWSLSMTQMAVCERNITREQAAELDALIDKHLKTKGQTDV